MQTNVHNKSIRISKIVYLKQRTPSHIPDKIIFQPPSVVHLSSLLQNQRKKLINSELRVFSERLSSVEQMRFNVLSENQPLVSNRSNVKQHFLPRQIRTSSMKRSNVGDFYLSQLALEQNDAKVDTKDQKCIKANQSKRQNYKLRRLQFKDFIDRQSLNKIAKLPATEQKQVIYQRQQQKIWQIYIKNHRQKQAINNYIQSPQ